MRHYPENSPQAQARIIVAALLADGGMDKSELELIDTRQILSQLGLSAAEFDAVAHQFWNDSNQYALRHACGELRFDQAGIESMLSEIDDPATQAWLLELIDQVVHADQALNPGEARFLEQARVIWNTQCVPQSRPRWVSGGGLASRTLPGVQLASAITR